jgi:hypothetical protein
MIGKRHAWPVAACFGGIFRAAAAIVVNVALSLATKRAGLCLRGNEKSMCRKYKRRRADP